VTRKLHHFHGGLHLEFHKSMSMAAAVERAPLPKELVLPLHQHIGEPAEPVVAVGDTVLKGQRIARATDYVSAPVHASTSGRVVAIEERPVPHPSGLSAPCIVIESDGEDRWCERRPVADYRKLDPSALRNRIRDAGIVGMGGAGFPSHIKLNPAQDHAIETLILNGAECEPYITCDARLMQERPREIIDGLKIMRHALHARQCLIGIEDNKPEAIAALREALTAEESTFIEICVIPTIYPAGGEKQLIKVLTGREIPRNSLPASMGIVCHNVGTAAAVYRAIVHGEPLVSRFVTVTGEACEQPRNLEVAIGTPVATLLDAAACRREAMAELILGGPMMGFQLPGEDVPVVKTSNCILALPQDHRRNGQPVMPCIRCGACADVCPACLLPQQLYWYSHARDMDRVQDHYLFDCIECGCCAYVCPSHIPLVHYFRFAKTEIWAREREKKKADLARRRHEFRLERLEREKREKEERQRRKKELLKQKQAGKDGEEDAKKAAIEAAMQRVRARREEQHAAAKNAAEPGAETPSTVETGRKQEEHGE